MTAEAVPDGQLVQDDEPAALAYEPAPHKLHTEALAAAAEPAAQVTQEDIEVAPTVKEAMPEGQG